MFDFLLGLSSILNAVIDVAGTNLANNATDNSANTFVTAEKPCFQEEQEKNKVQEPVYKTDHYISAIEARDEYNRRLQQRKMKEAQKEQENINPFEKWVLEHNTLILDIIKNPGVHIIRNEELGNVPTDRLIDLLFAASSVESVEKVPEGIEVITR